MDHVGQYACPIKGVGPKSPSDQDYNGGFATSLMFKDLCLAQMAIEENKTAIDYGLQSLEKFKLLIERNEGNLDFSNIVNL